MSDHTRGNSADGLTLIELIVYMMLVGLVLAIVGTMMINTARTSETTTRHRGVQLRSTCRPLGRKGDP